MSYIKLLMFLAMWTPAFSQAAELGEGLNDLEVHGFLSQGYIKTTANQYLTTSNQGSFDFTEAALNFTKRLSQEFRMGFQFFAQNLGQDGSFRSRFDWFYLDYSENVNASIRIGRIKMPFGLYNEYRDIDTGRMPVLLPQSVYNITSRDLLLALNGIELYGRIGSSQWRYNLYGGTIHTDLDETVEFLDVPYIYGGRLFWESPAENLTFGLSAQVVEINLELPINNVPLSADLSGVLAALSFEYQFLSSTLAIEYSPRFLKLETSNNNIFPSRDADSEHAYIMYNYQWTHNFGLGSYASVQYNDREDKTSRDKRQYDFAIYTRVDLNENWLVKFETHRMDGSALLNAQLNKVPAVSSLKQDWWAFLIKTTGYF